MGSRGPQPTPTNILSLRGSWRAKTRSDDEIQPDGKPICPRWLLPEAKKQWKKVLPQLVAMKIVGEVDGHLLARYCQMWAQWREAEEFLMAKGFHEKIVEYTETTAEDGTITKKPHIVGIREWPQVERARKLHKDLMAIENRFGMHPSARASMAVEKPEKKKTKKQHVKETLTSA